MTSIPLSQLAELCDARLEGDGTRIVTGPASLEEATADEVSFLAEAKFKKQLETTRAGAVLVAEDVELDRDDIVLLRCADPHAAFNRVVVEFAPVAPAPERGIHPTSVVGAGAEVAPSARIGPSCVIGEGARIGDDVILHANVSIGAGTTVGRASELHPSVVLYPFVSVGERCILHAGAVVGADGFGFEASQDGWIKTPQGGTVVIADDVEIGANSTIDRARFKATYVGSNVKIDNLVHIGHNCQLGRSAMFLGQCGIAGSTRVGEHAIVAGQAGIAGHLRIGDGARVGGGATVFRDVPDGADVWGSPAVSKNQAIRRGRMPARVEDLRTELSALRDRLEALEREDV